VFDVGAVGGVEPAGAEGLGVEPGVQAFVPTGAVFVVLQLGESGLGAAVDACEDVGVGIGLLEV
jgi:hypothetical protein